MDTPAAPAPGFPTSRSVPPELRGATWVHGYTWIACGFYLLYVCIHILYIYIHVSIYTCVYIYTYAYTCVYI